LDDGRMTGQWAENDRRHRRCLEVLAICRGDRVSRQPQPAGIDTILLTVYCYPAGWNTSHMPLSAV